MITFLLPPNISFTSFTTIRTFCKQLRVAQLVTDIHGVCFLFPLPHPKFSQLIKIFNSLGPEKFPLVEQTFFPSHKQMVSNFPFFWCLCGWDGNKRCKLGTGNGGGNAGKSLNFTYRKILAKKCYAKATAWEPLSFLAQISPRSCKDPEKMYKEAERLKSKAELHCKTYSTKSSCLRSKNHSIQIKRIFPTPGIV